MLRVVHANRLELLAQALLRQLPLGDPLLPITVVVPSRGTGQWLKQEIAQTLGIVANLDLVLASTFAWRVFRAFDPTLPETSEYDLTNLRWRVLRLMETLLDDARDPHSAPPEFAALATYVRDATASDAAAAGGDAPTQDASARKRYQLASRIADVFDQYLVYRRDWIARFETDSPAALRADPLFAQAAWQPLLWRALIADVGHNRHRATVLAGALQSLARDALPRRDLLQPVGTLPSSVAVFAVTSMPPDLLQLFCSLAQHIDVQMFVPNPCQEYWADIIGERAIAQLSLRVRPAARTAASAAGATRAGAAGRHGSVIDPSLYYETGNPLLASLGRLNRDFVDLVNEAVEQLGELGECSEFFAATAGATLLAHVQNDILELRVSGQLSGGAVLSPGLAGACAARVSIAAADRSLAVHACHGALREIEVLQDQLLQRFEQDAALTPRDIVVMIPDIATYAPYIEAVFGDAPLGRKIPYAVADRGARDESTIVEGLFALFDLVGARWTVSEVVGLLDIAAVQRRFGISVQGLAQIRYWLEQVGVRWGRDRAHWRARGLPVDDSAQGEQPNTWAFGVERLLLGYALPADGGPFAGVLPAANVDGQAVAGLTALLAFIAELDAATRALREPALAGVWRTRLEAIIAALFEVDADDAAQVRGLNAVHQALAALQMHTSAAAFTSALPLPIVREYLRGQLLAIEETPAYLSGRVTFCTLVPMRALPFRHVCLLGMNETDFPRRAAPIGFDLLALTSAQVTAQISAQASAQARPRKGDRSRAAEDRQMFLDALLSARESLYVSYVGRSDRNDAACNPSVLVSELLDYVDAHFQLADTDADTQPSSLVAALHTQHRLQPFAESYFAGGDASDSGHGAARSENRWFTYDARWLPWRGTAQAAAPSAPPAVPVPAVISGAPPVAQVSPGDLVAFVRRPSRWLLRQRFGVRFPDAAATDAEDEPFALDALQHYALKRAALDAAQHDGLEDWQMRAGLGGALPHGRAGQMVAAEGLQSARALAARVTELGFSAPTQRQIDCPLGDVTVTGILDGVTPNGWRGLRVGTLNARDRAELWLVHLLFAATGTGLPCVYIDEQALWTVDTDPAWLTAIRARAVLTRLVELMSDYADDAPRLLCDTAQEFATNGDLNAALKIWRGRADGDQYGKVGERQDPYVQVLSGGGDEPAGEWQEVALEVYGGMVIGRTKFPAAQT